MWFTGMAALALLVAAVAVLLIRPRLPIWARAYLIRTLERRYGAKVELHNLQFSLYPRVRATGSGLIVRRAGQEQLPPFMTIRSFSAESGLHELFLVPWHVQSVRLEGLSIIVPPRGQPRQAPRHHRLALPDFLIDDIQADGTQLMILPRKPGKLPLTFDIQRLRLHTVGKDRPLLFDAKLLNPKPPGEIESRGNFGPWRADEPGLTAVSGQYTFQNADLSVFRGISGLLSSEGRYRGALDHIAVQGSTDTPNFAVEIGGAPVHLRTEFDAVVDGTDGDTYLQPVKAHFLNSTVVAAGKVEGIPGQEGKLISLQVSARQARIQDLMRLAVKSGKPPMTGVVRLHSFFELPPGKQDIVDKLYLKGNFELNNASFTNPKVQNKIEALSRRGRGVQGEDGSHVASDFAGQFRLERADMSFSQLSFEVPGGKVSLHGDYGLRSEQLDFRGELKLQAELSQTTHGIKSFLLKPIDPLFRRRDAGTVVPIKVEGQRSHPHFGIEWGRLFGRKKTQKR
jgi:hypothetical protein